MHPGDTLRHKFLGPLGLSASSLARATGIPRSRVSEILSGKRAITPDTAMRLGRFFRMDPEFWLGLQGRWELSLIEPPDEIVPVDTRGFLVGPLGATPLPERSSGQPDTSVSPELLARLRASAALQPPAGPRELVHVVYESGQEAWSNVPK